MEKDIPIEQLLLWNQKGWIPGPKESLSSFLQRVEQGQRCADNPQDFFTFEKEDPPFPLENRVPRHHLQWVGAQLKKLYDITPDPFLAYYQDKGLWFIQPAATWILEGKRGRLALVQLRKKLRRGSYFYFYSRDEILAHEAVHMARVAFDEPKTEEIFAYFTSSSLFRRAFGPILRSLWEGALFFILFFSGVIFQLLSPEFFLTAIVFWSLSLIWLNMGIFRLVKQRFFLLRAHRKLKKELGSDRARAFLFRLTDEEIKELAIKRDLLSFIEKNKKKDLRWKILLSAYWEKNSPSVEKR